MISSNYRWIKHDKTSRMIYLPNLLQGIRMGLLEPEYFMTNVKGNEVVLEKMSDCRSIIREAMKVVCDLQFSDTNTNRRSLYSFLLRPRLPFEVLIPSYTTRLPSFVLRYCWRLVVGVEGVLQMLLKRTIRARKPGSTSAQFKVRIRCDDAINNWLLYRW